MRVSSIISWVSKKMDNLASLYGISFGVNDLKVAVGDVVKTKESCGSYRAEIIVNWSPFLHVNRGIRIPCKKYNHPSCIVLVIVGHRRGRFDDYIRRPSSTSRAPHR